MEGGTGRSTRARWSARIWLYIKRRAGLIAVLAWIAQSLAWFDLSETWVQARNLSASGCGFDGSCVDQGDTGPLLFGWIAVPLAGLTIGVALWAVLSQRPRHPDEPQSVPARPIASTFIIVSFIVLVAEAQNVILVRLGARPTPARARHASQLIERWVVADILGAVVLLALVVVV